MFFYIMNEKRYEVVSSNMELTKIGSLCLLNSKPSSSLSSVFTLVSPDEVKTNIENVKKTKNNKVTVEVENLASICDFVYNIATKSARVKNYFAHFNDFGIFMPKEVRESYFGILRNAVDNSIFVCVEIGTPYIDKSTGKDILVVKYVFEAVFVSEVKLSSTALSCNKKVLDTWKSIKHRKGWRNVARGLSSQFEAVSIKTRIYNGEDVTSPELEKVETTENTQNTENTENQNTENTQNTENDVLSDNAA